MSVKSNGVYVSIGADSSELLATVQQSEAALSSLSGASANVNIGANTSGLSSAYREAASLSSAMSALDTVITVTASAAGIGYCLSEMGKLQDAMLTLKGVSGATSSELDVLEKTARRLGATTSWSADEVAEGMVSLSRMGFSAIDVNESIEAVMYTAKGLGVEISDAAEMIGAALNQFGKGSEYAEEFADVLGAVTNKAAISGEEMATTLKYAGNAGNALGQSIQSVSALSAQLRNVGLDAQQAGSTMRNFYLLLQSDKGSLFEKMFNVNLRDQNGNFRDIIDVLKEAAPVAKSMGPELARTLDAIGVRMSDINGVTALLNQAEQAEKLRKELFASSGYMKNLSDSIESGFTGKVASAKSAVSDLAISVGQALEPAAKETLSIFANLTNALSHFVSANKSLIQAIAKSVGKFLVFFGVIASIAKVLSLLKMAWSGVNGMGKALSGINIGGNSTNIAAVSSSSSSSKSPNFGGFNKTKLTSRNAQSQLTSFFRLGQGMARASNLITAGDPWQFPQNAAETLQNVSAGTAAMARHGISTESLKSMFKMADKTATMANGGMRDMGDSLRMMETSLKNTYNLTDSEAKALTNVAAGLHEGNVKASSFEKLIKRSSAAVAKLKGFIKGVGASMLTMFAISTVIDFGRELIKWLNQAVSKSAKIREEMEKATAEVKKANEERLKSENVASNADKVRELVTMAQNYSSMSPEEKKRASQSMQDALKNKLITPEQARMLNQMSILGNAGKYSKEDIDKLTADMIKTATTQGVAEANNARDTISRTNRENVLNRMLGTSNLSEAELLARMKEGDTTVTDKFFASKMLGVFYQSQQQAQMIASNKNLTDTEKSIKIAELKKKTAATIGEMKGSQEYFGAGWGVNLNFAEKNRRQNVLAGLDIASDAIMENIDSIVKAVEYQAAAEKEIAATKEEEVLNLPPEIPLPGGFGDDGSTPKPTMQQPANFPVVPSAEEFDVKEDDKAERKQKAALEATKKAMDSAREMAEAATSKLTGSDIENITPALVANTLQKIKYAEGLGVDVSDQKKAIRETFGEVFKSASESLSRTSTSIKSTVFTDAVSAAFSASGYNTVDLQKEQLREIQKLVEKATQQYAISSEILNQL